VSAIKRWVDDVVERLEESVVLCDNLLLMCSLYWRNEIKTGVVKDSIDDLLDIRKELCNQIDEMKGVLEDA